MTKRSPAFRSRVGALICLAVIATAGAYSDDVLEAVGATQHSSYTELAVVDPDQFDDGVEPGEVIPVSITNRTGGEQQYTWRFVVDGTDVRTGAVVLADAGSATIDVVIPDGAVDATFALDAPAHALHWSVRQ